MQQALRWYCDLKNYPFSAPNIHVRYWHEADLASLMRSGRWVEIEIKISVSDFKADKKKTDKHQALKGGGPMCPNYFYYAVPDGMQDSIRALVPEYAGLLVVPRTGAVFVDKKAPLIHKNLRAEEVQLSILKSTYFRFWKLFDKRLENA